MSDERVQFTCMECGKPDCRDMRGGALPCLHCGKKSYRVVIAFADNFLDIRDELDAEATDLDGELAAERLSRGDGNLEASLASDRGKPAVLSVTRKERVDGFQDEGTAAQALARAYNARNGTQYTVMGKETDDYDYADRVLESKNGKPELMLVQIRHLDTDVIARLGKKGEFDVNRTASDLIESINIAIGAKSKVDPRIKPKTLLLLQIPVMLGKLVRRELQRWTFDLKGFRGVWIAPFRDDCFEVFGTLQHDDISKEAYRLWEQEGHPWRRDHEHWYRAIDNLRRL